MRKDNQQNIYRFTDGLDLYSDSLDSSNTKKRLLQYEKIATIHFYADYFANIYYKRSSAY